MSWGLKTELREELREELAEKSGMVKIRSRELETRAWEQNLREQKHADELALKEENLATRTALETAKLDIERAKVSALKDDLETIIDQVRRKAYGERDIAVIEERASNQRESVSVMGQLARAEQDAAAKDQIIASKNEEIARLDELLKVTMGKLTQIDIKGLTIHVENAKPAGGNKPEGK